MNERDVDVLRARFSEILAREVPCRCIEAYTARGLEAPDCQAHDAQRAVDSLVDAIQEPAS